MSGAAAAPPFVHLHLHSEYSLLDGACKTKALCALTKEMGMPAVAVTDHGNLYGAVEFYLAAQAAGVKPIIGAELYIAPGDRRDKEARGLKESSFHLLLLSMNLKGYQNLMKLCSLGFTEGFYRKPRIDKEVLREFNEGLICTSACIGGEVPHYLLNGQFDEALQRAESYADIFGPERYFIEVQDHGMPEEKQVNPQLVDIANRVGARVVASNDVHYLRRDDVEAHDVLCCINTHALVKDEDRFRFPSDQFYFKTAEEMAAALPDYHEAIANTVALADMCDVQFDFSQRFAPKYAPPDNKSDAEYLRELVYAGAEQRYEKIDDELRERIDYELSVISSKGFSSYFLIVWDFVNFARAENIPVNTRGSGCSSVTGYCLGISGVDPIHYGLYFERFMDPDRDEMPDIDVDICQDRRPEVIEYVRRKYGHVAQIITFGRLKARAAIRDICRALDVSLDQADRVAKMIPEELKMTIDKALDREEDLRRLYDSDQTVRKVLDIGRRLEGLARHTSIHAAGVVVADVPLDTLVPLARPSVDADVTTQFEGPIVEKVGLLKMDFLGLRTLSQIQKTVDLVKQHHGVEIDLDTIDLTDQTVYKLLQRGDTRGIFQFESGGMRDVLQKMKPNRIEDLIAANALFRPGPMAYIDDYVARKHGRQQWTTPHPQMTEVLEETYGIMVYQEQVSRLVNRLGGVPLKRAFRLAKAISKKKEAMINAERGPFIDGAVEKGVKRETAEQIFADILQFGSYAFNKAHSTGYGVVAYRTAYLKTYYPVEFMASLLTYEAGSTEKIAEYLDECRRICQPDGSKGVDVKAPDINESDAEFTVIYPERNKTPGKLGRGVIRFGLEAISGVGQKAIDAVKAAREDGGPFRDLFDFCERVDLSACNRAVIETLIKAGAFDGTGAMRRALVESLDQAIEHGQTAQRDKKAGQLSIFGGAGAEPPPPPPIGTQEWSDSEMLAYEKAALGFYITKHPLTQYESIVRGFSTTTIANIKRMGDGQKVVIGGLVTKLRTVPIRNGRNAGKKMLIVLFEDFTGSIECVVFSEQFAEFQATLRPDAVVFIEGTVDGRREEPSIRLSAVTPVEEAMHSLAQSVMLRIRTTGDVVETLPRLRELCERHRGGCEVFFQIASPEGWEATVRTPGKLGVELSGEFVGAVRSLAGIDDVLCKGAGPAFRLAECA